ncbi:rho guanine nucleotide exchange factor 11 isoform X3 [Paroedura picta]|uniref:rho guanine nucleotide exchange factor 11 isoform X3 n=1 Tax=Paroedura picta TaxID=143630 RepID=UPI004057BA36
MSMRPPQAALDRTDSKKHSHLPRLSSLSLLGDSAPERHSPGHRRQPSDCSESTGLVQRCVIIQKDQHGFGFTVSGDRIVLVQSVRPGGAAMKAGVQEGDRIVKVNGTMVTNSSHLEVVKLIKSGAYVALTLLGSPPPPSACFLSSQQDGDQTGAPQMVPPSCPPPPPPPPLPPPQRITGPKPLQDPQVQRHATQILRNMLRQEEAELQHFYEVYSRNPASPIEEQIEGARRRVSQLQLKIRQEMGVSVVGDAGSVGPHAADGCLSVDSQDGDSGLDSGPERFPSVSEIPLHRNSVLSDPGVDSPPHTSPLIPSKAFQHHWGSSADSPFPPAVEQGTDGALRPLIIGPEEDCDPGYFHNHECDALFQDLGRLKSRPAHLGVFLRYIFSQADPSPLLLYLCADVCQQTTPKEARGLSKDLWNIFLDKNALLRVKVPDQLLAEIESRLRSGEDPRSAFSEVQEAVMPEIQEQIQDYRTKRTMGLGSLYGENDLLDLDGDPHKERQVAERQIARLGEILSKYEEDRSSPMSFALSTYMSHAGIRMREPRPASAAEKWPAPEKEKWLPFFPKAKKQSSSAKKEKEKEASEDRRRNPILKYIGKPRSTSQSTFHVPLSPVEVKPGNVRNIIQHFENSQSYDPQEAGLQRLSTGSFPEDLLETDSARAEVKLGRSESLKGQEELKRLRKAENVPRSRSDVDMEAAAEATRLHQSASSSASSLSARSLENPTPPYTPKMGRRSVESPHLGFSMEDDFSHFSDLEPELDAQNWQHTVGRDVAAFLPQREVDRQEVINELFVTEASHLRILRVLDLVFCQRLRKENLLSREELALLFPNLPELIEIHNSLSESMKKLREENLVVKEIGDFMLSWFDGPAREEIQQVAADFCAYQAAALELIKTKKRKESRFQLFLQEAESHPQCRRLQLKDLLISEMQRLTKYPLLLENVLKHTPGDTPEHRKLCRARDQCREILRYVNEAVRRAENQHRLEAYQKRLDATSLERTSNPLAAEFKNLDLRSRRMIHEGPLNWRISKEKTVELHVLLLEDLLVLLQRQDEKLVLKCHSKTDTKQTFSPVLKLNSVLIRSVATDKRALFIICTSELGPQIYELVALTSSEKNTWMELLDEAVKGTMRNATFPPKHRPQQLPLPRPAPASLVLQEADIPPSLTRGEGASSQGAEEEASLEETPTEAVDAENRLGLPGEPEADVSLEDEEEEEMQPGALGAESVPPQEEESRVGRPPGPLAASSSVASLAESALEDVETLRLLLLQKLLPSRDPDPDEDLTPTPSVVGSTGLAPQDSGGSWGQAVGSGEPSLLRGHSAEHSGLGHAGPEAPGEQSPGPAEEAGAGTGGHPMDRPGEAEGPVATEVQGPLRVVRKAPVVEGACDARPWPAGSQADRDAGGGSHADGNYFYVSFPGGAESHTDAGRLCPPEPPHPLAQPSNASPAAPHVSRQHPEDGPQRPSALDGFGPLEQSPPSGQVTQDLAVIFRTIQQLTLKLTKLKDVEMAHQELQQSLSREASLDAPREPRGTSPGGEDHPGSPCEPWPILQTLAAAEPGPTPSSADSQEVTL